MLPGLKVVEQRHQAVLEVLQGATVSGVAHRFQVARRTVHVWLGALCGLRAGRVGRQELEAVVVPAPDEPRGRGEHSGHAPSAPGLGAGHGPVLARAHGPVLARTRRPTTVARPPQGRALLGRPPD